VKLKVTITKKAEGVFVVLPAGSVDTDTHSILEKEVAPILDKPTKAVILDMAELNYISSMGLRAIFKIKQRLTEQGGALAITNLQPQVKKVFEVIEILPEYYFSTMEEAEQYLDEFLTDVQQKEIQKRKSS